MHLLALYILLTTVRKVKIRWFVQICILNLNLTDSLLQSQMTKYYAEAIYIGPLLPPLGLFAGWSSGLPGPVQGQTMSTISFHWWQLWTCIHGLNNNYIKLPCRSISIYLLPLNVCWSKHLLLIRFELIQIWQWNLRTRKLNLW